MSYRNSNIPYPSYRWVLSHFHVAQKHVSCRTPHAVASHSTCTHTNHELFPQPAFRNENWCPTYIHTALTYIQYMYCIHISTLLLTSTLRVRLVPNPYMNDSCHTYEWVMSHMHVHTYTLRTSLLNWNSSRKDSNIHTYIYRPIYGSTCAWTYTYTHQELCS